MFRPLTIKRSLQKYIGKSYCKEHSASTAVWTVPWSVIDWYALIAISIDED